MNAESMILLYSKYSTHCKMVLDAVASRPPLFSFERVCVDNLAVRKQIERSVGESIRSVPAVILVYGPGKIEKFEGPNISAWFLQQLGIASGVVSGMASETGEGDLVSSPVIASMDISGNAPIASHIVSDNIAPQVTPIEGLETFPTAPSKSTLPMSTEGMGSTTSVGIAVHGEMSPIDGPLGSDNPSILTENTPSGRRSTQEMIQQMQVGRAELEMEIKKNREAIQAAAAAHRTMQGPGNGPSIVPVRNLKEEAAEMARQRDMEINPGAR